MVALLLPLSSLWAAMVTTSQMASFNLSNFMGSRTSQEGEGSESGRKTLASQSTSTGVLDSLSDRKGSLAPISPMTIDSTIEIRAKVQRDSTELDLEAMGVRVDRSYAVHTGNRLGRYGMA
jgi:pheromone alpha factor receptor